MTNQPENWRQWVAANLLPQANGSAAFEPGPANPPPFVSVGMHSVPSFDVIEALPPAAADKLRLLRQRSTDAHAIIPPGEEVRQASMAKIEAANALRRLTDHPQDFGFALKPDDPRVIAAEKLLAMETDKFERVKALQETRSASWQNASAALSSCDTWLRHGKPSGVLLQDFDGPEPKLAKNESVLDAIERLRRRCRELRADLHRIASAPYPSSHAKAQMREIVEQLATRGAPDVANLVELDREIIWPMLSVQSEVYNAQPGATVFAQTPDTSALLAWLFKDQLIAALDAEIASEADDKAALSHEAREQAEAEVQADLLDIERQEAVLVWQAQAQSLPCERRSDCSPSCDPWRDVGHHTARRRVAADDAGPELDGSAMTRKPRRGHQAKVSIRRVRAGVLLAASQPA